MKFLKDVEKHVRDLFKGKNVITNVVMLAALVVIVWFIIDFFVRKLPMHTEGFDLGNIVGDIKTEGKKILCLFHMNECGHCKKMMPEWDKFCANNPTEVECVKIEAGSGHPWLEKHQVQGFPTIKYIEGDNIVDYDGDRSASAFEEFCKSRS